jgi:hypothetical protein
MQANQEKFKCKTSYQSVCESYSLRLFAIDVVQGGGAKFAY